MNSCYKVNRQHTGDTVTIIQDHLYHDNKDGYEDYKRYKSDQEENNKETRIIRNGQEARIMLKDVLVGDLIMVKRDEYFPADMLLIASSHYKKGQCFIETKNLDGETNLKTKSMCSDLQGMIMNKDDVSIRLNQAFSLTGHVINSEGPNPDLLVYRGYMTTEYSKLPVNASNLLLRGCVLRNTEYILGCAIYTGYRWSNKPSDEGHVEFSQG